MTKRAFTSGTRHNTVEVVLDRMTDSPTRADDFDECKVRRELAAIRSLMDEVERWIVGQSSPVTSSLVQQLADELEHLARALRTSNWV